MDQLSFSEAERYNKRKRTRREIFLDEMDRSMPWDRLESIIEPYYPKAGKRPPSVSSEHHATYSLLTAMVLPKRSNDGGRTQ